MPLDVPSQEKLIAAERNVAGVRLGVIVFNVFFYFVLMERASTIYWLAVTVSVVALAYAIGVLALQPWKRFPLIMSATYTSLSDGSLITAWILATGGFESPFYVLWYVSLVAIAFRFDYETTLAVALLYAAVYVGLLVAIGEMATDAGTVLVRTVYIFFVGLLGGLISQQVFRQTRGRFEMQQLADMATAISGAPGLDQALERVVDTAMRLTSSDRGAVYLVDADSTTLHCAYKRGLSDAYIQARLASFETLPGASALRGEGPMQVLDAQHDGRLDAIRDAVSREGIRTYAVFPLTLADQGIGALTLYRDRVQTFSPEERELATTLASHAAIAIDNARLFHELRDSEERFRTVAETAHDAILTTDGDGLIVYANSAASRLFAQPAKELVGSRVDDLLEGDEDTEAYRAMVRALADGSRDDGPVPVAVYGRRRDGTQVPLEVSMAAWHAFDGDYYSAIIRDLTERKRAEQERLQALEQLKELERLKELDAFKTQFINTAAHELGTPLTPIRLQLHMLQDEKKGPITDAQRKSVAILERNVERLIALVQDILEGARLQANRLGIEKEPMDLNRLALEAVESFGEASAAAGVRIETRLAPNMVVEADPKRMMQVLFNLLSNALKFTTRGGRIEVTTETINDMAAVHVRDTGIGIEREALARLFRPFSQVHDAMQQTQAGTGLGLYICRGIIELHGGRIWAESPGPNLGARFSFAIPIEARDATPTPEDQSVAPIREPSRSVERRVRDLV
jgi:PAS domain S-box-containing protein